MRLFKIKKMTAVLICISLLFIMGSSAFALTISPPYQTPVINGYVYTLYSVASDRYIAGGGTIEAMAMVNADTNVPIGYMGANARLFNSAGSLIASSGTVYNTSSTSGWIVYSSAISTPGVYYAQNTGSFYNGSGYTVYTGYASPLQTFPSSGSSSFSKADKANAEKALNEILSVSEYNSNRNGETYGSALSADTIGFEPDLIAAVGTNGINGYVRPEDLSPKPSAVGEALAQVGENGSSRTIPLYTSDGTTVIGTFDIVTRYEVMSDDK